MRSIYVGAGLDVWTDIESDSNVWTEEGAGLPYTGSVSHKTFWKTIS